MVFSWILCFKGHNSSFNIFDRSFVEFFISSSTSVSAIWLARWCSSIWNFLYVVLPNLLGLGVSLSTVCSVSLSPIRQAEQNSRQSRVLFTGNLGFPLYVPTWQEDPNIWNRLKVGVPWITEFPLRPNKVLYEGMRRKSREDWFAYLHNEAYPKYKRIHFYVRTVTEYSPCSLWRPFC